MHSRQLIAPRSRVALRRHAIVCVPVLLLLLARAGQAQSSADTADLAGLVRSALAGSPVLRAARLRADAARARVSPSGLRPDPMLMVGVQNFPVSEPGFEDFMTMKMVGIQQTIPHPGKLGLQRRAAESEVDMAQAVLAGAERQVTRDVQDAYYDLAFVDQALAIVARNRDLLVGIMKVAETRYSAGTAGQQDVLRARLEASRLAEQAVTLTEQRRATLARLNAALGRSPETTVPNPAIPLRITRAAVADSAAGVRFTSAALGARASGSPLPPLAVLQETALRESPALREDAAKVAAQAARLELARKSHLPDFDVSIQYGQRRGYSDMVSAVVSVPLPLQKGRRQDAEVTAARADSGAFEADREARANDLRVEVARLVSELERQRTQLALYKSAIIPQGRAALTSATASYQVGRVEFVALLENQATVFNYETEYFRVLTDFAKTLAELERVVGAEVLP